MTKVYELGKRATITKGRAVRRVVKRKQALPTQLKDKIRVGILCGKDFDPIPRGTQLKEHPVRFRIKNNTGPRANGWGGMFHIDAALGAKIARLHPDIFHIDFMDCDEITQARLKNNHLNFNLYPDVVVATYKRGKKRGLAMKRAFQNPECRMWPSFDYYDWICTKSRYMKQCQKAGIPIIDTIFVETGFDPEEVLKKVQAKGWDRFFVKSAAYVCFGNAAIHGKTRDFINDKSVLKKFVKDNADTSSFLVQPYMLKPDGNVFDEVRNFFIDGKWSYSVYTDGTDEDAVYEQPPGAIKTACKDLSLRVFEEVLKRTKWQGKALVPLLVRIDIGVMPDKSQPAGVKVFLNEIECEVSTWLARYVPFNLCDRVAEAAVKKCRQMLAVLIASNSRVPNSAQVRRLLQVLDDRLGPLGTC